MQISAASMEISMEFPQKLKIELPYYPAIPLLDIHALEFKSECNQDTAHPCLYQHYHNSQSMESSQAPING
jgi:hypothetical protein